MRKLLLALLLWGVPVIAHASCAQIIGGDDASGCVEIDSCGGDACDGQAIGVFLDPVFDGTENEAPHVSVGLTPDQPARSTFHIAQKIGDGVGVVMTTPITGHGSGAGFLTTFDSEGAKITNFETGTDGNIEVICQDGYVRLSNDDGSVAVQPDGNTAVSGNLYIFGNIDMKTDFTAIRDASENGLLRFDSVASAVNEMTLANAATGGSPTLSATGGDTNISMTLAPKGTGGLDLDNDTGPLLIRLGSGGVVQGKIRTLGFAGIPFLDFISSATNGQVRVQNSAETVAMMTCDDALNDSCSFEVSRLLPKTTMPTCNSAFEGAMAYDGDGVVNGPCICAELVAGLFTWQPLLPTAADCS